MTEPPAPVRVLLVGMMGSGKTTVGQALAGITGWPYVDNDAMVAELSGTATPDLQAQVGGDALHVLEAVVCDRILVMDPPLVAGIPATSGGSMARIRSQTTASSTCRASPPAWA